MEFYAAIVHPRAVSRIRRVAHLAGGELPIRGESPGDVERGEDADRAVVRRVDDDAAVEGALEQVVAAVR